MNSSGYMPLQLNWLCCAVLFQKFTFPLEISTQIFTYTEVQRAKEHWQLGINIDTTSLLVHLFRHKNV